MPAKLDTFTRSYVECALWSSTGDDGQPLDRDPDHRDIAPDSLARMVDDCRDFQEQNASDLAEAYDWSRAGHDFWLTRNGHGAGFWDGGYPEALGERLTAASKRFGECDLYVGDDGKIHASP